MANTNSISNPVTRTLVYANVFIAICALAQVLMTYILFEIPFDFKSISYLVFIPVSTFLQYNIQRGHTLFAQFMRGTIHSIKNKVKVQYNLHPMHKNNERMNWIVKHRNPLLASLIVSFLLILFLCNWLSWTSLLIMIGAEVVSTLYYMKPFNLRRFGYIKPFLISAVWAISCVLVPLIEFNIEMKPESYYFILAKFLFIGELCVVFDINDSAKDFRDGVFTYANKLGLTFTKIFCIALLAGSGVLYGLFIKEATPIIFASAFLILCSVFSLLANNKKHSFYYYLMIDGLMIAQPIFYLAPFFL